MLFANPNSIFTNTDILVNTTAASNFNLGTEVYFIGVTWDFAITKLLSTFPATCPIKHMWLAHNHYLKHQKSIANCYWPPCKIPLVYSIYSVWHLWTYSSSTSIWSISAGFLHLPDHPRPSSWLWHNIKMICLLSSTNGEINPKGP